MTVIGFHATRHLSWMVLPLAACMTVVRLCAKRWSADAAARWSAGGIDGASHLATCRRWGDGLAPQGILGLMVALSFFHVWADDVSRTVLAAIAAGSIINELLAPWLLLRLLRSVTESAQPPEPHEVAA